jgi:hypothetical protein
MPMASLKKCSFTSLMLNAIVLAVPPLFLKQSCIAVVMAHKAAASAPPVKDFTSIAGARVSVQDPWSLSQGLSWAKGSAVMVALSERTSPEHE